MIWNQLKIITSLLKTLETDLKKRDKFYRVEFLKFGTMKRERERGRENLHFNSDYGKISDVSVVVKLFGRLPCGNG